MLHRSRLVQVFFPLLKKMPKCTRITHITQPHALISCPWCRTSNSAPESFRFHLLPSRLQAVSELRKSPGNGDIAGTLPIYQFAKTIPWTSMDIFHIFLSFRILHYLTRPYLIKPDSIYLFLWLLADFQSIPSLIFRVFTLFTLLVVLP